MTRVAVVGATGNIGTAVLRALAADPAIDSIVGVARRPPDLQVDRTEWVTRDVATDSVAELAAAFTGADAVVHLAWAIQPTHQPGTTWRVNAVGSERVFAAAAQAGVQTLVYSSSVGAYSPGPKDRPVDETWPTDSLPTAAYGREKAYVERVLDAFEARHPEVRVVRLRPAFVFQAAAGSEQWRIFANRLLPSRVVQPSLIPVVPFPEGLRFQVVHADDAAEAFRLALTRDVRGAFNIAADPVIDGEQIGALLDARVVRVPRALLRAAVAGAWHLRLLASSPQLFDLFLAVPVMDTARARTELGWTPRHTAVDALRALLDGLAGERGAATAPLEPPPSGDDMTAALGLSGATRG